MSKSKYKPIGEYIRDVKTRNGELKANTLLGINIDKFFMPSVANVVGTDMSVYKIVKKGQFACNRMHVGRDFRLPVAMSDKDEDFMVSPAYDVFEIIDTEVLLPEYLMMWFSRKEFDRNSWFYTDADVRGGLNWKAFCEMSLPVPSIEKQREIVKEYNVVADRIKLNNRLIQKLEETAQAIYKQWFVDFEFPDENGKPYKSSGGEMEWNEELGKEIPKWWRVEDLSSISDLKYGKMLNEDDFTDNGFPVFSGYGIRGFYIEYMYEEPQILVIARGVSGTGEVRMSPPKSYITNLSIVVENKSTMVNRPYLYYFLMKNNLRSLDSGSAQSQITINDLYNVRIIIPPIRLQNEFGDKLDLIKKHSDLYKSEIKLLESTKNLLLSKLATIGN